MKFDAVYMILAVMVFVLMFIIIYFVSIKLEVNSPLLFSGIIITGSLVFPIIGAWLSKKKAIK
jgi:hypothetical protein